jgi:hypothetical protein
MIKATGRKRREPGIVHRAAPRDHKTGIATLGSYLPAGSTERTAAEVGVAAIGALLVAAVLGVGPAALAGTAGYLVYRETREA